MADFYELLGRVARRVRRRDQEGVPQAGARAAPRRQPRRRRRPSSSSRTSPAPTRSLSDPQKRQHYDRFGDTGNGNGGGGGDPFGFGGGVGDIFDAFFGGQSPFGGGGRVAPAARRAVPTSRSSPSSTSPRRCSAPSTRSRSAPRWPARPATATGAANGTAPITCVECAGVGPGPPGAPVAARPDGHHGGVPAVQRRRRGHRRPVRDVLRRGSHARRQDLHRRHPAGRRRQLDAPAAGSGRGRSAWRRRRATSTCSSGCGPTTRSDATASTCTPTCTSRSRRRCSAPTSTFETLDGVEEIRVPPATPTGHTFTFRGKGVPVVNRQRPRRPPRPRRDRPAPRPRRGAGGARPAPRRAPRRRRSAPRAGASSRSCAPRSSDVTAPVACRTDAVPARPRRRPRRARRRRRHLAPPASGSAGSRLGVGRDGHRRPGTVASGTHRDPTTSLERRRPDGRRAPRPSPTIAVAFALDQGRQARAGGPEADRARRRPDHPVPGRPERGAVGPVQGGGRRAGGGVAVARSAVEQSRRCWVPDRRPVTDVRALAALGAARVDRGGEPPVARAQRGRRRTRGRVGPRPSVTCCPTPSAWVTTCSAPRRRHLPLVEFSASLRSGLVRERRSGRTGRAENTTEHPPWSLCRTVRGGFIGCGGR